MHLRGPSHHSADCLSGHQRDNQEAINDTHLRGLISPLVQRLRKLASPEALTMSVRGLGERREAPAPRKHRSAPLTDGPVYRAAARTLLLALAEMVREPDKLVTRRVGRQGIHRAARL